MTSMTDVATWYSPRTENVTQCKQTRKKVLKIKDSMQYLFVCLKSLFSNHLVFTGIKDLSEERSTLVAIGMGTPREFLIRPRLR